ncbi:MAG: molybdenum cofactor guanylyltransferase [Bacillota bacterium]
MTKRAAIILAGGKGRRFQSVNGKWQDKALAEIDDKPLLVHAIENIQDVVEETVVVVDNNELRTSQYQNVLDKFEIKTASMVKDLEVGKLSGPLIAILTGLKSTHANYCITIPADVPMLSKKVAQYLFDEINGSLVAVPMWPNGRLETLLMVLERRTTLNVADVLCQLGRSHPDDIIRGAQKTLFASPLGKIKTIDPELRSFININCPEDLRRLQPRQGQGSFAENVRLDLGILPVREMQQLAEAALKSCEGDFLEASEIFSGCAVELENKNLFFWAALAWENEGKTLLRTLGQDRNRELADETEASLLKAAQNYGSEAEVYLYNRCLLLADRAKADKSWCDLQVEKLASI